MIDVARRHSLDHTVTHGRPMCYHCLRPLTHCFCNVIVPFAAHCKILILQHPHERIKYYATAKMVANALTNSRLIRGIDFLPDELPGLEDDAYLLYPRSDAVPCEEAALGPNSTVVVLDGTWSEAGKILHRNPKLKALPCLTFQQRLESEYRIRKQPRAGYLSTIESVSYLLKFNALAKSMVEQAKLYDRLLYGFNAMIEHQLLYVTGGRPDRDRN